LIWVVDASVALRWLLEDEQHPLADEVLHRMIRQPGAFAVPELFLFEVYSVLCRLHPKPLEAFERGILAVIQSGIHRHPMTDKLARAAEVFVRLGLTGYDACYAALASDLGGTWLTFDRKAHRRITRKKVSFLLDKKMPAGWA